MTSPTPWKSKITTACFMRIWVKVTISNSFLPEGTKRKLRDTAHFFFFPSGLSYLLFDAKFSNANKLWFQEESRQRSVAELMDIYFDFVTGGRAQSREYLNNLEMNIQLPYLQSPAQAISLTEALFISGNCCHNVLLIVNASLGIHTQSEPNIPKSLDMLW